MRRTGKENSLTIMVDCQRQKSAVGLNNITEYFEAEKQGLLVDILRANSSVRNISYYHRAVLAQMTSQLVADAKQEPSAKRKSAKIENRWLRLLREYLS